MVGTYTMVYLNFECSGLKVTEKSEPCQIGVDIQRKSNCKNHRRINPNWSVHVDLVIRNFYKSLNYIFNFHSDKIIGSFISCLPFEWANKYCAQNLC